MPAPLTEQEFNAALSRALRTPQRKAWFREYEDVVWPMREWPADEARLFLGTHAGHDARWKLCKFSAANGIPPLVLAQWCVSMPGYLRAATSCEDMAKLLKTWQDGTHTWKAWSMACRHVVAIEPMAFAREQNPSIRGAPAGRTYWDQAYALLTEAKHTRPRH